MFSWGFELFNVFIVSALIFISTSSSWSYQFNDLTHSSTLLSLQPLHFFHSPLSFSIPTPCLFFLSSFLLSPSVSPSHPLIILSFLTPLLSSVCISFPSSCSNFTPFFMLQQHGFSFSPHPPIFFSHGKIQSWMANFLWFLWFVAIFFVLHPPFPPDYQCYHKRSKINYLYVSQAFHTVFLLILSIAVSYLS